MQQRDERGRYSAEVTDAVLCYLLRRPHTRHEIADVLGLTPMAIHVRLCQLEDRGEVVRLTGDYHDRDRWLATR